MRRRVIWILAGVGGTLLLLATVILPLMVGGWPPGMEGEIGRRRVVIEIPTSAMKKSSTRLRLMF